MSDRIGRRTVLVLAAAAGASLVAAPAGAQRIGDGVLVFFDYGQSALTEAASKLVDAAANAIPQNARVNIVGHCDSAEPEPEKLGFARANAVLTQLLRHSRMARVRFNVMNEGTSKPLLRMPPNTKEPQNRRVEIIVGRGF
jgi:OOP family OmpA-OmpF porin